MVKKQVNWHWDITLYLAQHQSGDRLLVAYLTAEQRQALINSGKVRIEGGLWYKI